MYKLITDLSPRSMGGNVYRRITLAQVSGRRGKRRTNRLILDGLAIHRVKPSSDRNGHVVHLSRWRETKQTTAGNPRYCCNGYYVEGAIA